jgi:hypothetical protein
VVLKIIADTVVIIQGGAIVAADARSVCTRMTDPRQRPPSRDSRVMHRKHLKAVVCAGLVILLASAAQATDLTGIWASEKGVCDKVFVTKGGKTSFQRDSDLHGSGFIIEGTRLRGRIAKCSIVKTKMEGATINMIASCATDIMLSTVQFTFKAVNENEVTRLFPGLEGMEIPFYRCPKERP